VPVALYMDVHIPKPITVGLRLRGVDVMTAQEDGATELSDPALLDRATELQRLLFTFDDDHLVEASLRQEQNISFAGVVYARFIHISVGTSIRDLEIIAKAADLGDITNQIFFLPL
jgi:Domain of unknown function (DUF5615)